MKVCVLGISGADSQMLFDHKEMVNLHRLMDFGFYGQMDAVIPPSALSAWICTVTGRNPGSIGIYGDAIRIDRSYASARMLEPEDIAGLAIWDRLQTVGKRSKVLGFPWRDRYSSKTLCQQQSVVWEWAVAAGRDQWDQACIEIAEGDWDYFQVIDRTPEVVHRFGLAQNCDAAEHGNALPSDAVFEFYKSLDAQLGRVMELLDDNTSVMLVSPFDAHPPLKSVLDINDWLIDRGFLVLQDVGARMAEFDPLLVNWEKTRAWSAGEDCAQVFMNLKGREPQGVIEGSEYETFREEIRSHLTNAFAGHEEIHLRAWKPEELFGETRNIAPDLIVYPESSSGTSGMFVFSSPSYSFRGKYNGATFLDMAPTLLSVAGCELPDSMQGRTLLKSVGDISAEDSEKVVHDRLAGLGYV
jgi:predicted AlkP superfamily phosphohydrolase/phosphomutase